MANFNRREKRFPVFFFFFVTASLLLIIGVKSVIAQEDSSPSSDTEPTDINVLETSTQSVSTVTASRVSQSDAETVQESTPGQSNHQTVAQSVQEQQTTAAAAAAADIQGNASQPFVSGPQAEAEAEAEAAANDSIPVQSMRKLDDGLVTAEETTASAETLSPRPQTTASHEEDTPGAVVALTSKPAEYENRPNNDSTTYNVTAEDSNALEEDLATAISKYAADSSSPSTTANNSDSSDNTTTAFPSVDNNSSTTSMALPNVTDQPINESETNPEATTTTTNFYYEETGSNTTTIFENDTTREESSTFHTPPLPTPPPPSPSANETYRNELYTEQPFSSQLSESAKAALVLGAIVGLSFVAVVGVITVKQCLGCWARRDYSNLGQRNVWFGY